MAVNVPLSTISQLTEQTTAADTDCMVIGGTDIKKIKWSTIITLIKAKLTGAVSTILTSNLATGVALISNSSGKVAASSVTSTELGYLSGLTGSVQTQLNNKQASLGYTPVQQGGGTGQASNKLYLGWAGSSAGLKCQVDATDLGVVLTGYQVKYGTTVLTFSAGKATLNLTFKPNAMLITPQSGNYIMRYDWDNSTTTSLIIYCYTGGGTAISGSVRFAYLALRF